MDAIGKGKGKLAGNNHLGDDGVYSSSGSSGGASGANDGSGAGGNNESWANDTDRGVWSDGEGIVEMKDQVGGDLLEEERKAITRRVVECTICKDAFMDHERNPCVRAPCCKAIAHKCCVEEWLRRESRCFVCPNVITTRHGRASYFAQTLTAEDLAVEGEQEVQRKLADPGDLRKEFQKAREKFFAGSRASDEEAFSELLAMENPDGSVPFADFVAQQEKVLAQVLAKKSMQATEAEDETLARQLEEEGKARASLAADEALARKLEEEEKAQEAAAALKAKKELEKSERVARELAERLEKEAAAEEDAEVEFEVGEEREQEMGDGGEEGKLRDRVGSRALGGLAEGAGREAVGRQVQGRGGSGSASSSSSRARGSVGASFEPRRTGRQGDRQAGRGGSSNGGYGPGIVAATAEGGGHDGGRASSKCSSESDNSIEDEEEEDKVEDEDDDEEWVEEKRRKTTYLGSSSKRRISRFGGKSSSSSGSRGRSSNNGRRGSNSRQHGADADAGAGVDAGTGIGFGTGFGDRKASPAASPKRTVGQSEGGRAAAEEELGQVAMCDEEDDEGSDGIGTFHVSVPSNSATDDASPVVATKGAKAARMAAAAAAAASTRRTALAAAAIAAAGSSKGYRGGVAAAAGGAAAAGSGASDAAAVRPAASAVRGGRSSYGRLPAASKRSSSAKRNINGRLDTTAEEDARKETNTIDLSRGD